ncbi:phage holin [Sporosarcina sp. YIM B06819]|uniref:phage holin n=1 Tax=Sporosarcina sp. YIM B06819 TaxID=3081769 RepID=UPI00298CD8E4|nr:phage holin [Sporosarcina sp. YIM B06819]
MDADRLKQYVALFGGWLSALLLYLGTLNVKFEWFDQDSITALETLLMATIPFAVAMYGVYKNSYRLSKKAKEQEETLKRHGLK